MWNAGIILCGSGWLVLYAKRFRSPNRCSCTMCVCSSFSIVTTGNGPSCSCDPLPISKPGVWMLGGAVVVAHLAERGREAGVKAEEILPFRDVVGLSYETIRPKGEG